MQALRGILGAHLQVYSARAGLACRRLDVRHELQESIEQPTR